MYKLKNAFSKKEMKLTHRYLTDPRVCIRIPTNLVDLCENDDNDENKKQLNERDAVKLDKMLVPRFHSS